MRTALCLVSLETYKVQRAIHVDNVCVLQVSSLRITSGHFDPIRQQQHQLSGVTISLVALTPCAYAQHSSREECCRLRSLGLEFLTIISVACASGENEGQPQNERYHHQGGGNQASETRDSTKENINGGSSVRGT